MTDEQKEPLALPMPTGVDRLTDLGTLVTLREAADHLGVSVKTVRRMVARGAFPGAHQARDGGTLAWQIPYAALLPHKNEREQAQAATPASVNAQEITDLRARVAELEQALALAQALADFRERELERVHLTFRAIGAGADSTRRRWRRSKG